MYDTFYGIRWLWAAVQAIEKNTIVIMKSFVLNPHSMELMTVMQVYYEIENDDNCGWSIIVAISRGDL